jgi:hypothetical protein
LPLPPLETAFDRPDALDEAVEAVEAVEDASDQEPHVVVEVELAGVGTTVTVL